jgi:hypothetical protein
MSVFIRAGVLAVALSLGASGLAHAAEYPPKLPTGITIVPASGTGTGTGTSTVRPASPVVAASTAFTSAAPRQPVTITATRFTPRTLVTSRVIMPNGTSVKLPRLTTNSAGTVKMPTFAFTRVGTYTFKIKAGKTTKTVVVRVRR